MCGEPERRNGRRTGDKAEGHWGFRWDPTGVLNKRTR